MKKGIPLYTSFNNYIHTGTVINVQQKVRPEVGSAENAQHDIQAGFSLSNKTVDSAVFKLFDSMFARFYKFFKKNDGSQSVYLHLFVVAILYLTGCVQFFVMAEMCCLLKDMFLQSGWTSFLFLLEISSIFGLFLIIPHIILAPIVLFILCPKEVFSSIKVTKYTFIFKPLAVFIRCMSFSLAIWFSNLYFCWMCVLSFFEIFFGAGAALLLVINFFFPFSKSLNRTWGVVRSVIRCFAAPFLETFTNKILAQGVNVCVFIACLCFLPIVVLFSFSQPSLIQTLEFEDVEEYLNKDQILNSLILVEPDPVKIASQTQREYLLHAVSSKDLSLCNDKEKFSLLKELGLNFVRIRYVPLTSPLWTGLVQFWFVLVFRQMIRLQTIFISHRWEDGTYYGGNASHLRYALEAFSNSTASGRVIKMKYFWMDGLCVPQVRSISAKSHMMKVIYNLEHIVSLANHFLIIRQNSADDDVGCNDYRKRTCCIYELALSGHCSEIRQIVDGVSASPINFSLPLPREHHLNFAVGELFSEVLGTTVERTDFDGERLLHNIENSGCFCENERTMILIECAVLAHRNKYQLHSIGFMSSGPFLATLPQIRTATFASHTSKSIH